MKKEKPLSCICCWLAKIKNARTHEFVGYYCVEFDEETTLEECKKCPYRVCKE